MMPHVEMTFKDLVIGGYNQIDKPLPQLPPIIVPLKNFKELIASNRKIRKVIEVDGWKIIIKLDMTASKFSRLVNLLNEANFEDSLPRAYSYFVPIHPDDVDVEAAENPVNDLLWSARIKGTFDISLP